MSVHFCNTIASRFLLRLAAAIALVLILPIGIALALFVPGSWTKYSDNPVFDVGAVDSWDDTEVIDPAVLFDGSQYRMWYTGADAAFNLRIGYATSSDGLSWTRASASPVLITGTVGSWDADYVRSATVISDAGQYKMWYTGRDASKTDRIGYATSPDGLAWTKSISNPVLDVGAPGSWDAPFVGEPSVIKAGGVYKMWYRGGNVGGNPAIGYATSTDGVNWTKYSGNPVLAGGSSESWDNIIGGPQVVFDGARYHMWYTGCDSGDNVCQVGYATSSDGVVWSKLGLVLPPGTGSEFDCDGADYPAVVPMGSTLKMWYSGLDVTAGKYRIGHATASTYSVHLPMIKK